MTVSKFGLTVEVGKSYIDRQGLVHTIITVDKKNNKATSSCYWGEWDFDLSGQVYPNKFFRRDLIQQEGPYAQPDKKAKYTTEHSNSFSRSNPVIYGDEAFLVRNDVRVELIFNQAQDKLIGIRVDRYASGTWILVGEHPVLYRRKDSFEPHAMLLDIMKIVQRSASKAGTLSLIARNKLARLHQSKG